VGLGEPSLDDVCFRPRWVVNDTSSSLPFDTFSRLPFDTQTLGGLGNGFENLITEL
jgi:hypothetical protein